MANKRIFCDFLPLTLTFKTGDYQYWSPIPNLQKLKCISCNKTVARDGECYECTLKRLHSIPSSPAKD